MYIVSCKYKYKFRIDNETISNKQGMRKKMCGRKRFPIAAYLNPIKLWMCFSVALKFPSLKFSIPFSGLPLCFSALLKVATNEVAISDLHSSIHLTSFIPLRIWLPSFLYTFAVFQKIMLKMSLFCGFIITVFAFIPPDELLQNKKEVIISGLGAVINDSNVKVVILR